MKQVNISTLKSRLSAYLFQVRRGDVFEVCDRTTPVAWLVPVESFAGDFRVEEPTGKSHELSNLPKLKMRRKRDAVQLLMEDRDSR